VGTASARAALRELCVRDPAVAQLVERYGERVWQQRLRTRTAEPFAGLVQAVVGQQVSVAAARAIYGRLEGIVGEGGVTAAAVLGVGEEGLRAVGLSRAKARCIQSLAEQVCAGRLALEALPDAPDEAVRQALEPVVGIGRWTVEMFLIFQLGRLDVLPCHDLGLRRAVARHYGLARLPTPAELERLGSRWRPYRSLATLYLWRLLADEP